MKKTIILVLLIILGNKLKSSDTLSIYQCYAEAIKNYPLAKNKSLTEQESLLKQKNYSTTYFPQINISAQATYQSEVTKIELPFPSIDITTPSKDQYKLYIDIKQPIYDGGIANAQKKLENTTLQSNLQEIEVELYSLKERINTLYFAILLYQKNSELLKLIIQQLNERLIIIETLVKNGVSLYSDYDVLKAELLNKEQQLIETTLMRSAYIESLGKLINKKLSDSVQLTIPQIVISYNKTISRPENEYFDLLSKKIETTSSLITASRNPKLWTFCQTGYGRPAFNMFDTDFKTYYYFGIKASWNVYDWQLTNRQKQILAIQKEMINTKKEVFEKNIDISLTSEKQKIEQLTILIAKDNEIIELRKKITKTAASQLENGTITAADYITELNAELQAQITLKSHTIKLAQAKINYATLIGN